MKIPEFEKSPTVVVYQKRTGGNYYMVVTLEHLDVINNLGARKPIIPHKYKITELGIGRSLIETWAKKYEIKSFEQL
jgi:hypothetical protein